MPNVSKPFDFEGWATKNDLRCADGLIIRKGAFSVNNGKKVPMVWNHKHGSVQEVLGHAILEDRDEGVYAYGYFNNTPAGQHAKETVLHGDVSSLSIWANNLQKSGRDVMHGVIRELSLVLAGANPGARIESVVAHGFTIDDDEDEGMIYTGESIIIHAAPEKEEGSKMEDDKKKETGSGKTVGEIYDTLNSEQKDAVAIIVGQAIQDAKSDEKEEGDDDMKHNAFEDQDDLYMGEDQGQYISHSDLAGVIASAKKNKASLRETLYEFLDDKFGDDADEIKHSLDLTGMTTATGKQTYGFNDPSMLFPEFRTVNGNTPEWLSRDMEWVTKLLGSVSRTPFSRIKSVYANITEDDARARGYIKGKQKKEEVFTTLKRTTDPQTIYKKQKLDRDDVIDITDFDVVPWIRNEMRTMLNEEIARAVLIGDGRPSDSDDKIQEAHVRPIVTDVPLFNIKVTVDPVSGTDYAETLIDEILRARKKYKGSGNPTLWTTEDILTEMLLLKDKIGHRLYKTEQELATALRVSSIETVEPMEGTKVDSKDLIGVIVNMRDYNIGADKGGQISNFEDFDIDFNQMKYLIETRISGALIKPFSAITLLRTPTTPTPSNPSGGGGTTTESGGQKTS